MIIDTHIHLDDDRYNLDFDEVLSRAQKAGVIKYIIPAADPVTLKKAVELSSKFEEIYFAVGVHPYDANNYSREFLEEFISNKKCVAVGECGLDYFRLPKDATQKEQEVALQKEVFIDQIELANRYNKPLIVHIREATKDSYDILKKYAKVNGVLHCFNASEMLLDLANDGFYFGIGGVITFKNAKKLVEVYPKIPIERLLVETDGPYLTPHPYRGTRNEPAYCSLILDKMSELSNMPKEKLENIVYQNSLRLFNLSNLG